MRRRLAVWLGLLAVLVAVAIVTPRSCGGAAEHWVDPPRAKAPPPAPDDPVGARAPQDEPEKPISDAGASADLTQPIDPRDEPGTLEISVVDADGRPRSAIHVAVIDDSDEPKPIIVATDVQGRAAIPLSRGSYTVAIDQPGYAHLEQDVDVWPNDTAQVELKLLPGAELKVFVEDEQHRPVPNLDLDVSAIDDQEFPPTPLTTDEDGRARIELPAGEYEVTFSSGDFLQATTTVTLDPMKPAVAELELHRRATTVEISTRCDGAPCPKPVRVSVSQQDANWTERASPQGTVALKLAAGPLDLEAVMDPRLITERKARTHVDVPGAGNVQVTLDLVGTAGTSILSGDVASSSGIPLTGVSIDVECGLRTSVVAVSALGAFEVGDLPAGPCTVRVMRPTEEPGVEELLTQEVTAPGHVSLVVPSRR